jgi:hypothetical protein
VFANDFVSEQTLFINTIVAIEIVLICHSGTRLRRESSYLFSRPLVMISLLSTVPPSAITTSFSVLLVLGRGLYIHLCEDAEERARSRFDVDEGVPLSASPCVLGLS